jgi:hypothetical protein
VLFVCFCSAVHPVITHILHALAVISSWVAVAGTEGATSVGSYALMLIRCLDICSQESRLIADWRLGGI